MWQLSLYFLTLILKRWIANVILQYWNAAQITFQLPVILYVHLHYLMAYPYKHKLYNIHVFVSTSFHLKCKIYWIEVNIWGISYQGIGHLQKCQSNTKLTIVLENGCAKLLQDNNFQFWTKFIVTIVTNLMIAILFIKEFDHLEVGDLFFNIHNFSLFYDIFATVWKYWYALKWSSLPYDRIFYKKTVFSTLPFIW